MLKIKGPNKSAIYQLKGEAYLEKLAEDPLSEKHQFIVEYAQSLLHAQVEENHHNIRHGTGKIPLKRDNIEKNVRTSYLEVTEDKKILFGVYCLQKMPIKLEGKHGIDLIMIVNSNNYSNTADELRSVAKKINLRSGIKKK